MIRKIVGVEVGLPEPEEFTKELAKSKPSEEMMQACITEYLRLYHECAELVMNGKHEEADLLRSKYLPKNRLE